MDSINSSQFCSRSCHRLLSFTLFTSSQRGRWSPSSLLLDPFDVPPPPPPNSLSTSLPSGTVCSRHCVFPSPALESASSPGNPGSLWWRMGFGIWMRPLGAHVLIEVLLLPHVGPDCPHWQPSCSGRYHCEGSGTLWAIVAPCSLPC